MIGNQHAALAALIVCVSAALCRPDTYDCRVRARTEAGWVCGARRRADNGILYASFRGVPYAKQPLGELRFKELQPLEEWDGYYDATNEGPICPQTDVLYGRIMQPQGMSEACIHANVHVPLEDLPGFNQGRLARQLVPPIQASFQLVEEPENKSGLPIVVFIHGGGFAYGSGDADLHGPEYLLSKRVIVITFNYRLNVMGFLSLNSTTIPGNNGLRDMVSLLCWVQRNARAFGGNPDDVTLAGQSAGASSAHLLSLSPAAEGLFKRVWLMSGVGLPVFFSTSPAYAQFAANTFLAALNINSTDPEEIHAQLVDTPIEKIVEVNGQMLDLFGLTTFVPVVESPLPGVTTILDDDPETLALRGRGKDIPIVVGFTNAECETFRPRFEKIDIVSQIKSNPVLVVSPQLIYTAAPNMLIGIATSIQNRYFNGTVSMDDFVELCTDHYFKYPAMRYTTIRREVGGAPIFLYQFSYENDQSVIRQGLEIGNYRGAAHIEDMTYIFRGNSILGGDSVFPSKDNENNMKDWMATLFTNFVQCSNPAQCDDTCPPWPPSNGGSLKYQEIDTPGVYKHREPTVQEREMTVFFDSIFDNKIV